MIAFFFGNRSQQVNELIKRHISNVVDLAAGSTKEIVQILAGTRKYTVIKNIVYSSFMEDFRVIISRTFDYTQHALDLESTLRTKMQGLPPSKFARFLHPIFQEDEWKLITVGAILGGLAGILQLYIFF